MKPAHSLAAFLGDIRRQPPASQHLEASCRPLGGCIHGGRVGMNTALSLLPHILSITLSLLGRYALDEKTPLLRAEQVMRQPEPQTPNPKPQTPNSQPHTPNSKPRTQNPQTVTPNHHLSRR